MSTESAADEQAIRALVATWIAGGTSKARRSAKITKKNCVYKDLRAILKKQNSSWSSLLFVSSWCRDASQRMQTTLRASYELEYTLPDVR